ncbi:NAD(P)-dependent dehydrogenase (short-subunit alcohol dehydrogenase family) [Ancylobacter sp. 3268]|uniref:SDR family oxidoreductase n=1 Tax=Ancylobacter sp. 3268 TaxID=2817752 RepID=UPI00285E168F|nr:SDR family oxidoreductase [Ancylobacter sp. 3268]MDR6954321.1 NAD(P)-dependent dehydrogenase (short-subunit alcohol dehydrogenase family) [Ancylobacter sp. 3268]
MARFNHKHVLITGGTSGMGLAGARRIAAEGGAVAVTGLDAGRLAAARDILPADTLVLSNDAADPAAALSLTAALHQWALLDGVWLNAGYAAIGPLEQVDAGAFDAMMAANVRGPMLQLAALSPLLAPGASVVVTSSSSTYEGAAMTGLYAATKGAVVAMARSWATAFAPRGIRVNVLVPGPIDTNFRHFLPEEARRSFEGFVVSQVPLGRAGTADEAAAVALFLLSDDASYVTGSQYAVDGGLVML